MNAGFFTGSGSPWRTGFSYVPVRTPTFLAPSPRPQSPPPPLRPGFHPPFPNSCPPLFPVPKPGTKSPHRFAMTGPSVMLSKNLFRVLLFPHAQAVFFFVLGSFRCLSNPADSFLAFLTNRYFLRFYFSFPLCLLLFCCEISDLVFPHLCGGVPY